MAENQLANNNRSPTEEWKAIPGYEGYYEASTYGNIRSVDRILNCPWGKIYPAKGKYKKQSYGKDKYLFVCLSKENKHKSLPVHRLIAKTFIPNPNNKPQIDHIDGDKTNNRVDNLRWCTAKENNNNPITRKRKHEIIWSEDRNRKVSQGLMGHPVSEEARRKMSEYRKSTARKVRQFDLIGNLVNEWNNSHEAAESLGVRHCALISMIHRGKRVKGKYKEYIFNYVNKN